MINFSLRKLIFCFLHSINVFVKVSLINKEAFIMLKPLGERIVIKVIEDTEQTTGGIFIPESAKEKPQKGEVVAVGQGEVDDKGERKPMDVKVGDVVLYAKYAGTDVKLNDVSYKILSIKDALAIVE